MSFDAATYQWARCAIELLVNDVEKSKTFYLDILRFQNMYERHEFIYMDYHGAQIMLDQRSGNWETGDMQYPFGRGINLQIETPELDALLQRVKDANWPLYEDVEEKRRDLGGKQCYSREFLVQDPDGYLLRFSQSEKINT